MTTLIEGEEDSLSEQDGYDSEAAEHHKGSRMKEGRTSDSGDGEELESDSAGEDEGDTTEDQMDKNIALPTGQAADGKKVKPLTLEELDAHNKRLRKTGVIYISRIPPYMSPAKIRSLLSHYGTIGRVFLTPESREAHSSRVKSRGNKKRSFVDGWVEFLNKRDAKFVAETLNAQIVGGRKGGWYHDDLWNIKYLKGFKWSDLVEQVKNEEAERAGRLRVGRERGRKEEKEFLKGIERAKIVETKDRKRKARDERGGASVENESLAPEPKRTFRQHTVKARKDETVGSFAGNSNGKLQPGITPTDANVRKVLGKIF